MSDQHQSMSLDQAVNIDDDFSYLLEDFFDARSRWYYFGLHLGLTDATLESFKGDDEEKFKNVLRALLHGNRHNSHTPITLSCMLSALKSRTVGLTHLAKELERKYTSERAGQENQVVLSEEFTDDTHNSTNHSHNSTESMSVDQGYSNGTTDASPQKHTTQPDLVRMRYKRILTRKLQRVRLFYDVLIKNGRESFMTRFVPVNEVIEAAERNRDKYHYDHQNFSQATLERMSSMNEIWDAFSQHTSWYKSEMVEGVVRFLGNEADKKNLKEYLEKRESLLHHLNSPQHSKEAAITLKLEEEFGKFTKERMELVCLAICDLLECHTCALDKEEGCVKITLSIPADVAEDAFPLSPAMRDTLQKVFPTIISVAYRDIIMPFELKVNIKDTGSALEGEEEKHSDQGSIDEEFSSDGSKKEEEEEKVEKQAEGEKEKREKERKQRKVGKVGRKGKEQLEEQNKNKESDFQKQALNTEATSFGRSASYPSILKHQEKSENTSAGDARHSSLDERDRSNLLEASPAARIAVQLREFGDSEEFAYLNFKDDMPLAFRYILINISQQLSDLEVAALAYINSLPWTIKGKPRSALTLLMMLANRGEFSPSNVQPLENMLTEINRHDIIHQLYQYKPKKRFPSPPKATSSFETCQPQSFRIMLYRISQQLTYQNMEKLAFIYNVQRTWKKNTLSALSLLQEMEERGEFSPSNYQPLKEMMKNINRFDLVEIVKKYKATIKKKSGAMFLDLPPTSPKDRMTPILHYAYSVRLPINAETGQSGIGTGSGSGRYGSVESWREAIKTPPPASSASHRTSSLPAALSGARPTISQLYKLEGRGGRRVRVIETAAPNWRRLAYALNLSSAVVQIIAENSLFMPDIACENALSRWMADGPTDLPVCWASLLLALRHADLTTLASDLELVLMEDIE